MADIDNTDNTYEFRVRLDKEDDPEYPQYFSREIIANSREMAGELLEITLTEEIEMHPEPDEITWDYRLVDVH